MRMAIGRVAVNCENVIIKTTMTGTARNIPGTPQCPQRCQRQEHDHRTEVEPLPMYLGSRMLPHVN